jgi:hypothetical protein
MKMAMKPPSNPGMKSRGYEGSRADKRADKRGEKVLKGNAPGKAGGMRGKRK